MSDSLIDQMTREAQEARDAFGYGTVVVTEHGQARTYRLKEDWWDVADRAAVRFGKPKKCRSERVRGV